MFFGLPESAINHYFPGHSFKALCGSKSGALNGSDFVKGRCDECNGLADQFIADFREKAEAAHRDWLNSSERKRNIGYAVAMLARLDERGLDHVVAEMKSEHRRMKRRRNA
jgi:hypothetical protein